MALWRVQAEWRSASMECGEQCVAVAGITIMPESCADNWGTVSIQVNWRWEYIWQCSLESDVMFMVMDWSLPNLNFTLFVINSNYFLRSVWGQTGKFKDR